MDPLQLSFTTTDCLGSIIIYFQVVPTAKMVVTPGKHVDVNGRIYHPYLAYWKHNEVS